MTEKFNSGLPEEGGGGLTRLSYNDMGNREHKTLFVKVSS